MRPSLTRDKSERFVASPLQFQECGRRPAVVRMDPLGDELLAKLPMDRLGVDGWPEVEDFEASGPGSGGRLGFPNGVKFTEHFGIVQELLEGRVGLRT
jgi:hypothetical protein